MPTDATQIIRFSADVLDRVRAACCAGYPNEACGILVGTDYDGIRAISRVHAAANVWSAQAEQTHRYLIDPAMQMAIEKEAMANGEMIVGFYHSHPDHPAIPSQRDLDAAWPFYSYLIVTTYSDRTGDVRCWRLNELLQSFDEQAIES